MARAKMKPEGMEDPQETMTPVRKRGPIETGPESAGQSGDLQGLSDLEEEDSESVVELVEEGQYYEASVVSGVEDAPDADEGPIRLRRRPEDDLPPEYRDVASDEPKE
jgi:hypothetical protein